MTAAHADEHQVQDYMRIFEPHQADHKANIEHVCRLKESYKDNTIDGFRQEVDKYNAMAARFEAIPARATVGDSGLLTVMPRGMYSRLVVACVRKLLHASFRL